MAIQYRRGQFTDFDPSKLKPGEPAVVLSGDPDSTDGMSVYFCFGAGSVKRLATYDDMVQNIQNALEDVENEFTEDLIQTLQQANQTLSSMETATNQANSAASSANQAAQAATKAAEDASAVVDDITNATVTFSPATTRENVESGDTVKIGFGKIAKWFSDLKDAAFRNVANNCTTTSEGSVLDARQGKTLWDRIGNLNSLATTDKSSVVNAVNELNSKKLTIELFNGNALDIDLPGFYVYIIQKTKILNLVDNMVNASIGEWCIVVNVTYAGTGSQFITSIDNTSQVFKRTFDADVWSEWNNNVSAASKEYNGDCDDIVQPGFFGKVITPTNGHSPGFYSYILVLKYTNYQGTENNFTQVAFPYNSSHQIVTRYCNGEIWSEWE